MLTAAHEFKMRLWSLEDRWAMQLFEPCVADNCSTPIRNFLGHPDVKHVLFLDKGIIFVSGSDDDSIMLWSPLVDDPVRVLRGHSDQSFEWSGTTTIWFQVLLAILQEYGACHRRLRSFPRRSFKICLRSYAQAQLFLASRWMWEWRSSPLELERRARKDYLHQEPLVLNVLSYRKLVAVF